MPHKNYFGKKIQRCFKNFALKILIDASGVTSNSFFFVKISFNMFKLYVHVKSISTKVAKKIKVYT